MQTHALIDGDIILWKAANAAQENVNFGSPEEPEWAYEADEAKAATLVRRMISSIKNRIDARTDSVMLSPTKTKDRSHSMYFRHDILPSYKGHRAAKEKHPLLLHGFVRNFMLKNYNCRDQEGLEADDLLGIAATNPYADKQNIICSIDKDFKQIPGWFYDTMKGTITETDERDANHQHFLQVLIGDSVDNYKGCPGVGPVKAEKILPRVLNDDCKWQRILKAYKNAGSKKNPTPLTPADALVQAQVARILRWGDYDFNTSTVKLWEPPTSS